MYELRKEPHMTDERDAGINNRLGMLLQRSRNLRFDAVRTRLDQLDRIFHRT